jgi:hypothetical protein
MTAPQSRQQLRMKVVRSDGVYLYEAAVEAHTKCQMKRRGQNHLVQTPMRRSPDD